MPITKRKSGHYPGNEFTTHSVIKKIYRQTELIYWSNCRKPTVFIYLSFTGNSVVRHDRDAYATTFGKKIIYKDYIHK